MDGFYAVTLLTIIWFSYFEMSGALRCLGRNGKFECCNGYRWNDTTKNCRCLPGYFGDNCTSHCSPGRYGEGCARVCTGCEKAICNVSYGCPVTTEAPLAPLRQYQSTYLRLNLTETTENKHEEVWQMISAVFSAGTFVAVITALTIKCVGRWRTTTGAASESKGPVLTNQNYQALNSKTVFSGMANVVISLNTTEKNFSVVMKTEESAAAFQLDGVAPNGITTSGNTWNGSEKVYESLQ
ncbi:uncharacterized protein LOC125675288 isoform X3 [Ostrea edulis]|uniref:uncharacterized protein LOC125675288 isoform X3 n=1 Tax=Ostrea edulis TaxID=37623 RepID=UPI002095D178|nr:uncharacterized protein LOC125675288 isoform X3 [Ostrea edulis]